MLDHLNKVSALARQRGQYLEEARRGIGAGRGRQTLNLQESQWRKRGLTAHDSKAARGVVDDARTEHRKNEGSGGSSSLLGGV